MLEHFKRPEPIKFHFEQAHKYYIFNFSVQCCFGIFFSCGEINKTHNTQINKYKRQSFYASIWICN